MNYINIKFILKEIVIINEINDNLENEGGSTKIFN